MEGLIDDLTRGNVTEVKVVLATVAAALAVYQLVLAAVSYGRARPRFLESARWRRRCSRSAPAAPARRCCRGSGSPSSAC